MAKGTIFDAIFASAPLNRSAATVTSRGESYAEKPVAWHILHWKEQPKLRPITAPELASQGFADLSGRTFGRMRVMGLLAVNEHHWVVRCACGAFEIRSSKAIKNPANNEDRCVPCRRLQNLRDREIKKAKGIIPGISVDDALARLNGGEQ